MDITTLITKLVAKQNLKTAETKAFLTAVMQGDVLPSQIAAVLVALRMKGETVDELVGFIDAMREKMIRVTAQDAIDVCGTGGDGSNSINVSTAVCFVVAACGVPVSKHGNRAASSRSGAADVLEALGVHIQLTAEQAASVLKNVGVVFLFAPLFHPATKNVVIVRKELKIRTVFNFLGPFLNPAGTTKQLLGVPDKKIAETMIAVGKKLGYKHLVIVSGDDGMDEVSIAASTHVFELHNNRIKRFTIDPREYGLKKATKKAVVGGTAAENAVVIKEILAGKKGAKRDIVVLNSAVALYAADKVKTITDGIARSEHAIDIGEAKKVLDQLIKETKQYA